MRNRCAEIAHTLRERFEITSRSLHETLHNRCADIAHTLRIHCAYAAHTLRIRFEIAAKLNETLRNRCAYAAHTLRIRCANALRSLLRSLHEILRNRCANALRSLRNHIKFAAQSLRTLRTRCAERFEIAAKPQKNRCASRRCAHAAQSL
jgi:hypothetical protein